MANTDLKILGLVGSLRAASKNKLLLQEAMRLAPEGLSIEHFDLSSIPMYNGDLDTDENRPNSVHALKEAIRNADGVLLVTPEYNYSVPGVLKNAIDWASRPAYRSVFAKKSVGVMSATPGLLGGARVQMHLREILFGMHAKVFIHAEFLMGGTNNKFDESGQINDSTTKEMLVSYLTHWRDSLRSQQG